MLRSLKTFFVSTSACLLTLVAMSGVSTRCMFILHEPEIPESLKRDL